MTNEQKMRTLFRVYYDQCPDRRIEYTAESDTQVWIIMEGIELSYMEYQGEEQPIFMCGRLNDVYYFKTYAECDKVWNMGEDELLAYNKSLEEPSRDDMIRDLTKYELEFMMEDPSIMDDLTKFFISGGFNQYDDNVLRDSWNDKFNYTL